MIHICTPDDLHPYECGLDCIHCERKSTRDHRPTMCALCEDTAGKCKWRAKRPCPVHTEKEPRP